MWIDPQQPGLYLGQCAQFCGIEHAKMLLRVYVDTPAQFAAWVKNQQQPAVRRIPAVAAGRHIFETRPASTATPLRAPRRVGRFGPDLTHLMSRATIAAGAAAEHASKICATGSRIPITSKPGVLMPAMQLSDQQMDEVVAYLTTLH